MSGMLPEAEAKMIVSRCSKRPSLDDIFPKQ